MNAMVMALKTRLEQNANPIQARPMSAYMRNQFAYLGIKTPQMTVLLKQFYKENGLPMLDELDSILHDLWELPEREYQYAGMGLLEMFEKKIPYSFIETMEYLIVTKSWWDTVDLIAGGIVGPHFLRFPTIRDLTLSHWRNSENLWLRRTTLLFQLGYKKQTDFPLLCEIINENLGSKEFFINKAIGWALRQYSRIDGQAVRIFLAETALEPLSAREAIKWLELKAKDSQSAMAL